MDLRTLSTFIQVAECGSFSRTGEILGYSQPTVSVHIRQLEEELQVKLFDRHGHAVRLTDKGRDLLIHAQQICRLCQQMQQEASQKSEVRGVVRLATAQSLCAPLILKSFSGLREEYPNVRLELLTGGTPELFRLLDHNEADMVCTLDSRIYDPNYVTLQEEKVGLHFVVPASDPLSKKEKLTVSDLREQNLLLTEKGMSYRRQLDEWMAKSSLVVEPVLENGDADLLCSLVEMGMGISFLPDYVTDSAVARGTVVAMDAEDFHPNLWNQLLYRRDKWLSEPMAAVLEHLKRALSKEN